MSTPGRPRRRTTFWGCVQNLAYQGWRDRMLRYIPSGPLAANKRIAEQLFLKTYDLELEEAKSYHIWAYRKAAWAVDEWPESIAEIYRTRGKTGLRKLPGIGANLAGQIAGWLEEDSRMVNLHL